MTIKKLHELTGRSLGAHPSSSTWKSVTYGAGLFVAVSQAGAVSTSPDGVDWTTRVAAEANQWNRVVWIQPLSLFVAVAGTGTNRVMTSPDGITWTSRSVPAEPWMDVAYAPSLGLLAAVATGGGTQQIITSPDGITWTARTNAVGGKSIDWSASAGVFATVSASGTNTFSTDGITWTPVIGVEGCKEREIEL